MTQSLLTVGSEVSNSAGRVAVVCVLPSAGHFIPLAKMAIQVRREGFEVCCFVPAELVPVADRFGIPVRSCGAVCPEDARVPLARLGRQSRLRREFFHGFEVERRYFGPVEIGVLENYEHTLADIREFDPDVILADDHRFPRLCRSIADACSVPLVLHSAAGWEKEDRYLATQLFGGRWFTPLVKAPVRWATRLSGHFRSRWIRLVRPQLYREVTNQRERIRELRSRTSPPSRHLEAVRTSTGIRPLEERHLGKAQSSAGYIQLGVFPPLFSDQIDRDLLSWLDAGRDTPTILIAFGTMIESDRSLGKALLKAVTKADVRALWSGPRPPWLTRDDSLMDRVRWERFIPQPDVLRHDNVKAFVTHAGAGGVQEALWFGKPMLCVPHVWDQRYNAHVVRKLGAGFVMEKGMATPGRLARAIRRLVVPEGPARRAAELSEELQRDCDVPRLISLLRSLVDG